jgi:hypothetical protein
MIAEQIDGPRADEHERRGDRDQDRAHHDELPLSGPGFPVPPQRFRFLQV